MWERRRRLVRPEWDPTHNPWRAAADTLRSSVEDTAAMVAASPLFAAHRGFQVLQEPAHAAPDPKGPFLPESNHLLFPSCPRVGSNRGRSNSNAHLEVYGLECCPYTMPRQSSGRRTREPSLSIRRGARHGLRRFVVRGDASHGSGNAGPPCISTSRPRLRGRTCGGSTD